MKNRLASLGLVAAAALATPAAAEMELSLYVGIQSVDNSTLSGTLPGAVPFSRSVDWAGKPLENPFYYGGRAIWWMDNNIGFGLEGTHAKAYASSADMAAIGVSRFELSDGHNIITANVMKRWPGAFAKTPRFTPYLGAGVGVAIPHVDVLPIGSPVRTFGYETTGLALRGIAGLKYDLNENWALFSEYQMTWSDNDITIDPAPGQLAGKANVELVTHAVNFGISYNF
jgi:lipid A oxidase